MRLPSTFWRNQRRKVSSVLSMMLLVTIGVISADQAPVKADAAPAGPPNCWVGWRPSEGTISFRNLGTNDTGMTVKLKWRSEDLTFTTCRRRPAAEIEMHFGTSNGRHKLQDFTITSSDIPGTYKDSFLTSDGSMRDVAFGINDAHSIEPDRWYTVEYRFTGRLGPDEIFEAHASRNYRRSPCALGDALCVAGWIDNDKFGPLGSLPLVDPVQDVDPGTTFSWSFPSRSTLLDKIIRHPVDTDAYLVDSAGVRHWIPDGGTYNCLLGQGYQVVNSFAEIDQRWVINSFTHGDDATCTNPPASPQSPSPAPSPAVGRIDLSRGGAAPFGSWYGVSLSGLTPGSSVTLTCHDSVDPAGFYSRTFTIDGAGSAADANLCYSADGPDHWVTGGGLESNHVGW